jgi:hypothetical protein
MDQRGVRKDRAALPAIRTADPAPTPPGRSFGPGTDEVQCPRPSCRSRDSLDLAAAAGAGHIVTISFTNGVLVPIHRTDPVAFHFAQTPLRRRESGSGPRAAPAHSEPARGG